MQAAGGLQPGFAWGDESLQGAGPATPPRAGLPAARPEASVPASEGIYSNEATCPPPQGRIVHTLFTGTNVPDKLRHVATCRASEASRLHALI